MCSYSKWRWNSCSYTICFSHGISPQLPLYFLNSLILNHSGKYRLLSLWRHHRNKETCTIPSVSLGKVLIRSVQLKARPHSHTFNFLPLTATDSIEVTSWWHGTGSRWYLLRNMKVLTKSRQFACPSYLQLLSRKEELRNILHREHGIAILKTRVF